MSGYYGFLYHDDIMNFYKNGYKVHILSDNGFTAECIVYKLSSVREYLLKKHR